MSAKASTHQCLMTTATASDFCITDQYFQNNTRLVLTLQGWTFVKHRSTEYWKMWLLTLCSLALKQLTRWHEGHPFCNKSSCSNNSQKSTFSFCRTWPNPDNSTQNWTIKKSCDLPWSTFFCLFVNVSSTTCNKNNYQTAASDSYAHNLVDISRRTVLCHFHAGNLPVW